MDAWKQSSWGKTKLENKIDLDEVELDLPLPTKEEYTENHTENHKGLPRIQSGIIKRLKDNPAYSRRELADEIEQASLGGVISALSRLQELGIIKRVGPDKGGHWEIIERDITP